MEAARVGICVLELFSLLRGPTPAHLPYLILLFRASLGSGVMLDQINPHSSKEVEKIWPTRLPLPEPLLLKSSFLYVLIMNDICRAAVLLNSCQRRTEVLFAGKISQYHHQSIIYESMASTSLGESL